MSPEERNKQMTYGPVDFLALEFKGNNFTGEILPALMELVDNGTIRVIDLVIVRKNMDGTFEANELRELNPQTITFFNPLKATTTEMIKAADIELVGQKLENNSTAAVMLFEHLWAIRLKDALVKAGGRVVMNERIPADVVQEALDDLSLPE
jgi:hypothetical protein